MTDRDHPISPLRRRMIEDMEVRSFAPKTQTGYIPAVRNFTVFFGRLPDQASAEDLRRYQLHLRSTGTAATSMNAASTTLRFFFEVTLGCRETAAALTSVRQSQRIPVLLSPQEVARLLDHAAGGAEGQSSALLQHRDVIARRPVCQGRQRSRGGYCERAASGRAASASGHRSRDRPTR